MLQHRDHTGDPSPGDLVALGITGGNATLFLHVAFRIS